MCTRKADQVDFCSISYERSLLTWFTELKVSVPVFSYNKFHSYEIEQNPVALAALAQIHIHEV